MKKNLSKSKLMAFRQCPKRLWLEVHHPELREDSSATQKLFRIGHTVGEIARRLYDPRGQGRLVDVQAEGYAAALARTGELLKEDWPIFEAGFSAGGVLAFADILLKRKRAGKTAWHAVEVKSSGKVHEYQEEDLAVQAFAMREAGLNPAGLAIAHVDGKWVYPGNEDYRGLLKEVDLSQPTKKRLKVVPQWVDGATRVAARETEPDMPMGKQCHTPFSCPFTEYCESGQPKTEFPVTWLPKAQRKALKAFLANPEIRDMRQVPDELLNEKQLRVKEHTLANKTYFDVRAAAKALLRNPMPAYFLDFETVWFTVPIWVGTKPFQQIPFQFSLHVLQKNGKLTHQEFLDVTGTDPSRRFAEALIAACGERGAIYAYNATFETGRIAELADRFKDLSRPLKAIVERIIDLLPIAKDHYYHPAQEGSWSLKAVAPTIAPELDYDKLDGVADGGAASDAFLEAVSPSTSVSRKEEIEKELRRYCAIDTQSLVQFWLRASLP